MAQAYELEVQEPDKDWFRVPRRCADFAEALTVAVGLAKLYVEGMPTFAIRFKQVP